MPRKCWEKFENSRILRIWNFFQYVIISMWILLPLSLPPSPVQILWTFFVKAKLSCLRPLNRETLNLFSELHGLFALLFGFMSSFPSLLISKIVSSQFIIIWYLKQRLRFLSEYIVSYWQVYENLLSVEVWCCWKALLFIIFPPCWGLPVDVCSRLPSLG